ncbi:MAG: hypothetical protein CMG75_08000 [Candidatus Marinimicrobia bacterium]|nr:hypothetical protein [Candidatus Neomarinimicrobiota bacterium]
MKRLGIDPFFSLAKSAIITILKSVLINLKGHSIYVRNAKPSQNKLKKLKISLIVFLLFQLVLSQSNITKEGLISELENSLMAPCCWSGTVNDHGNPEMEEKISSLVHEGKSREEIFDYFVGIYGEKILAIPVASGFNLMAWIAPIFVLGIGTFVLINYLKIQNKPKQILKNIDEDIPYNDLIEKELKALE